MTKRQYLDELEAQLYFLAEDERAEAVREFASHIDDTVSARPDLAEGQVLDRLPPPASVAARYYAEADGMDGTDGPEPGPSDRGSGRRRGFSLGDMASMFRFARREERELNGTAMAVERIEIVGSSADLALSTGIECSWRITGRWGEEDAPSVERSGTCLKLRCLGDVDSLALAIPPGVVEVVVSLASGDVSADLPPGASFIARLASGDLSCSSEGGAIDVSTASGDISISGTPSSIHVGTASGDVYVKEAKGEVAIATQSGDIRVDAASGDASLSAKSLSGDISIKLAQGAKPEIRAESLSGEVDAPGKRLDTGPAGSSKLAEGGPGSIHAKSVSGDIRVL